MGLMKQAYETYCALEKKYAGNYSDEWKEPLVPVSHQIANADIEITLNADGKLLSAAMMDEVFGIYSDGRYTKEQAQEKAILKTSGYYPTTDENGTVHVADYKQMAYVTTMVNGGQTGLDIVLDNDISVFNEYMMMSSFTGTLDGQNHTIRYLRKPVDTFLKQGLQCAAYDVESEPEYHHHYAEEGRDSGVFSRQDDVNTLRTAMLLALLRMLDRKAAEARYEGVSHICHCSGAVESTLLLHLAEDMLDGLLLIGREFQRIDDERVALHEFCGSKADRYSRRFSMVFDEVHDIVKQHNLLNITFKKNGSVASYTVNEQKKDTMLQTAGFFASKTVGVDFTPLEAMDNYGMRDEQEKCFGLQKGPLGQDRLRTWSEAAKHGQAT